MPEKKGKPKRATLLAESVIKKKRQAPQEPLTPTVEKKKYQFYRDKFNLNDEDGD